MDFRHFRHFRTDYADYVDYACRYKRQKLTLSHYSVKAFGLLFVHFHGLSTFSTFSECIFPASDICSLKICPLTFMDYRHFKHYRKTILPNCPSPVNTNSIFMNFTHFTHFVPCTLLSSILYPLIIYPLTCKFPLYML